VQAPLEQDWQPLQAVPSPQVPQVPFVQAPLYEQGCVMSEHWLWVPVGQAVPCPQPAQPEPSVQTPLNEQGCEPSEHWLCVPVGQADKPEQPVPAAQEV